MSSVVDKVTSVFSPSLPEIPETKEMPVADEQVLAAARRRQAGKKGKGRASTVLTAGKKLGSSAGSKTLGG